MKPRRRNLRLRLFVADPGKAKRRKGDRVFDLMNPDQTNLIRLDPAEAPHFGAPGRIGFHLIDTTMMYAPRSGGVKRYLGAKSDWLARRRPDLRHTLVVPGPTTGLASPGVVSVAAARLPFGDGYRMPASSAKWETVLRMLEPDIIEAGDIFVPGHAALDARRGPGRAGGWLLPHRRRGARRPAPGRLGRGARHEALGRGVPPLRPGHRP